MLEPPILTGRAWPTCDGDLVWKTALSPWTKVALPATLQLGSHAHELRIALDAEGHQRCRPSERRHSAIIRMSTSQVDTRRFQGFGSRTGIAISPRGDMPKYRVLNHQGRSMSSYTSISPEKLSRLIGTGGALTFVDVRKSSVSS